MPELAVVSFAAVVAVVDVANCEVAVEEALASVEREGAVIVAAVSVMAVVECER
jgi:hypothetical protein